MSSMPEPVFNDANFRAYVINGVPFLVTTRDSDDGKAQLVGALSTECGMFLQVAYSFGSEDARDERFEQRTHDDIIFAGLLDMRRKISTGALGDKP